MNDENTSGDGGFRPSILMGGGSDSPTETPGGTRPEEAGRWVRVDSRGHERLEWRPGSPTECTCDPTGTGPHLTGCELSA